MHVKLNFPPTVSSAVPRSAKGGHQHQVTTLYPDGNGQCVIDTEEVQVNDLLHSGFTLAPSSGEARPTRAHPGMFHFDAALGRPVWRNAANDGWVDATGAAV